ncbi:hypothetical protein Cgig2_031755 [Carnegiea gigantea]|uniref:Endoplasmic reticulum transmembrane protein n=1 Tax=Carnegiea gigantea TaxID=171969 RepID=A0A9Q1KNA9_9CARY|nr:hypothetical protein Cgig2_031755 [Carnegiea gigantea]
MALEWVVLGYAAAAEAIMVMLLTIPGLDGLRKGLIVVTRNLLKPFLSVVPFCLFLLMDIYWKYETRPSCEADSCTPSEHLRHQKSIMKSQRNLLLIAAALVFYWVLYSVTALVVKIDQLNQRIERNSSDGNLDPNIDRKKGRDELAVLHEGDDSSIGFICCEDA